MPLFFRRGEQSSSLTPGTNKLTPGRNGVTGTDILKETLSLPYVGYRPYYDALPECKKQLYDVVVDTITRVSASVSVPKQSTDVWNDLIDRIRFDNPWVFYVGGFKVKTGLFSQQQTIEPMYTDSPEQIRKLLGQLMRKAESIVSGMKNQQPIHIEQDIHNYLSSHVTYDENAKRAQESIGPLLFGKGVCLGVSKAAKLLFDLCGVPATLVRGFATDKNGKNVDHAWNLVSPNGTFYHLDVTFDLTVQAFGVNRYDYFNLSDDEIRIDHTVYGAQPVRCPVSGSYYRQQGMLFQKKDALQSFLCQSIQQRVKNIVFQIEDPTNTWNGMKQVQQIVDSTLHSSRAYGRLFSISYNNNRHVFLLHEETS